MIGGAASVHGTAFLIGDRGVVVFGPSGSGKSALAQESVAAAMGAGLFAALVADDRVRVEARGGRLVAGAPEGILGGIEVRGAGLFAVSVEPCAVIHLVVRLVAEGDALRFPDGRSEAIEGVRLPALWLPQHEPEAAPARRHGRSSACAMGPAMIRRPSSDRLDHGGSPGNFPLAFEFGADKIGRL